MKAILLAAGSGVRLGSLTKEIPKALIDINGKTLLERQIIALQKNDINDIVVVTGPNNNKFNIKNFAPYLLVGLFLWYFTYLSGIHSR